ncbi:MAG: PQQ-binding-like beta-propeller repeat protein [Fimbriiglobus sp.]
MNLQQFCIGLVILFSTTGADWPQFRGSHSTGVAEGKAPLQWTTTEGIRWKAPLPGPGSSSPVVVGDRVFVTCYSGYGLDAAEPGDPEKLLRHLVCFHRKTGEQLWKVDAPPSNAEDAYRGYIGEHGYASNSPTADENAVYAFFGKAGVFAYTLEGKKLWETSVGTDSDPRRWGSSASPILYKNLVLVNASSEGRAIVALDKKTGEKVWKAEGNRLALSFSTPVLVAKEGQAELVVAMPTEIWSLNPDTGKMIWYAKISPDGNICPAVIADAGKVFVTGGYQSKGTLALKTGGKGDVSQSAILWQAQKSSYVPTPVLHEKRLTVVTEDGFALCLNAENGKTVYEERLSAKGTAGRGSRPFYASPILADGKLYAVSRQAGVFVLKAGDAFEVLQQNPRLDPSDFNATPAIVGNQLFLRSNKFLYCIGDK